jgi:nitroimidazol reductase NimA-like FMN-containing flavoprotein (pyridoxamine 5'-phosphate oxidase superfamily)
VGTGYREPAPGKTLHLAEAEVQERLGRARLARLGFVDGDDPVIVPVNVVVDAEQRIVFRTSSSSALAELDGRRVAVEVDGFDTAARAGWSVLVRGVARDVSCGDDAVAQTARDANVDCWAPGERERTFVVLPLSVTGRVIPVGPDAGWFPGVPSS